MWHLALDPGTEIVLGGWEEIRRWLKSEINSILPVSIYFSNYTMVMYDATMRGSCMNTENFIASQQMLCLQEILGLEIAMPACYSSTWETTARKPQL